jgi:type 1 glutamine amidotransferase
MTSFFLALLLFADWLTFDGKGKHIVLVSGDDEYRSEQAMPQLARILSKHHGFKTTVLFALDPDGTVNPERKDNIPGLEALKTADLMILFTRFRDLPDEQMKHIVDYVEAGKPIVAIRTATHAFEIKPGKKHHRWSWNSKEWDGGFGRQVLGETWVAHHGKHKVQSTRARFASGQEKHPILKGIRDGEIWGPTDVYTVANPLPGDSTPLLLGEVLEGMGEADKPAAGKQNEPKLPVAWTKTYKSGRIFTTTMGSSQDLQNEALRRLLVNASYWAMGLEKKIPAKAKVDLVGPYNPTPFGFGTYLKGKRIEDY